jgi:flagellar hook-associated protein 1 FlgK
MSDLLSSGASALLAFQRMLATTSHNVANASTPGYSRQRAELATRGGQLFGSGFVGAGVQVSTITRTVDQFIAERVRDSGTELGRLDPLAALAARVDQLASDPATSVSRPLNDFFNKAQALAAQPQSLAVRQEFLAAAETLAARVRSLDRQFDSLVAETSQRIDQSVGTINADLGEIGRLNTEIVRAMNAVGQPPNDLMDQRDRLIERVAGRIGVSVAPQNDGALNVFTASGQGLVIGSQVSRLASSVDPFDPMRRQLELSSSSGSIVVGTMGVGGELGGLAEFQSSVLDPAAERLGRIAAGLALSVNAQSRAGTDYYGDLGGDVFALGAPETSPRSGTSAGLTLTAGIADLATLDGGSFEFEFNGGNWRAVRRSSGEIMALAGSGTTTDPFRVGGVSLVLAGTPVNGDSFLVEPSAQLSGSLRVAVTDPNRLAAANPLEVSANLANIGTGTISAPRILDASNANLRAPVTIEFVSATSYTLNGSGPFTFTPGTPIAANGWEVSLDGQFVAGDRFNLAATGARSSDNGNARELSAVATRALFDQGTVTLTADAGSLAGNAGAVARRTGLALEAQQAISDRLMAEREAYSGVNLDEEAANMVRFQQAYQAAAQVISIANDTFQSLLAAFRR